MLLLAIHNHQPVGNPEAVLTQAYEQAYAPFLKVLADYPDIKLSLHFSGILLEWFEAVHPDFLDFIGRLVAKGQVEMVSGGFYEPILAAIPDRDKIGQVKKLNNFIFKLFGKKPRGLWLTERVWEPSLPKPLAEAGVEYTLVDSEHFLKSGFTEEELSGYYITEDAGFPLKIFPGRERLRYLIPFKPAKDAVDYILSQGAKAAVYADDGEKFGLWPGTYTWVYEQGWLAEFFKLLSQARIETWTLSQYLDSASACGRVYLGTCTYPEMAPWSLPRLSGAEALEEVRSSIEMRPYLMGGLWRNFLAKYEEANDLHKKMWLVSNKLQKLGQEGALVPEEAIDELYRGQCNDAYWHGVFGGLYLPHLRGAAYSHLIAAEKWADELKHGSRPYMEIEARDINGDGYSELIANSRCMSLYFALGKGGGLYAFDFKPSSFNLMNSLSRYREAYHRQITKEEAVTTLASIHHQALAGADLAQFLHFDTYRRASFLDHFIPLEVSLSEFSRCSYQEAGDFLNGEYKLVRLNEKERTFSLTRKGLVTISPASPEGVKGRAGDGGSIPVEVVKEFQLSLSQAKIDASYHVTNMGATPLALAFAVEFNITLEAGQAPDRYYEIPGLALAEPHLASSGECLSVCRVSLIDQYRGMAVRFEFSPAATLWRFPIETVSRSESGLEKVFQSSVLLPRFNLILEPGQTYQADISLLAEEIGI